MACPPTIRIQKCNHKNKVGSNCKDLELEKTDRTSKSGLHEISREHILKHQENVSKTYLLLTPSVVLNH